MDKAAFQNQYMQPLNAQQRAAVTADRGAVLLLAVPGSGKTTVLVTRLGYLFLCAGAAPEQTLTMTYTVSAANEMRSRFAARFGAELAARTQFRTLNGISAVILQHYSRRYRRTQPELITNEGEITQLLTALWQQVNHEYPAESSVKELRTAITYIKNMSLTDDELEELQSDIDNLPELYHRYQAALRAQHRMDYDDQMVFALQVLRAAPGILADFQAQYRHFCVDEAQDTSKLQHELLHLLAGNCESLFMVGDEDQSIYGFRAAYPQALLEFDKQYPGAQVLLLEHNYRSADAILDAANHFVARSRYRRPKTIRPTRGAGAPVHIVRVARREDQTRHLFDIAKTCRSETAVLFRNHESALPLIDLCERAGIPYCYRGGEGTFFGSKIVRDITDMIALAYDARDTEVFMRVYYKFGVPISRVQAQYACEESRRAGGTVWQALCAADGIRHRLRLQAEEIAHGLARLPRMNAGDAVRFLTEELGYRKFLEQKSMDTGKLEILTQLGENLPVPSLLPGRLQSLQAMLKQHTNNGAPLILSTIHSSKGLEYDRVFLLDAIDGVLPARPEIACQTPDEIRQYEEDRRLFYVGMTRARDELTLFFCAGEGCSFVQEVIYNLPENRARREAEQQAQAHAAKASTPPARPAVPLADVTEPGTVVEHLVFGRGVVLEYDGRYLTLQFTNGRKRKLDAALVTEKGMVHRVER